MTLTMTAAQSILACAFAHARDNGAKALAAIVVDTGGHLVAAAREDGASFFRNDIARAKALGAIGMGDDTRTLTERAKANTTFFQSLSVSLGGEIAFSPGGVLIRDGDTVIGALGISGDTGEFDEECAAAGIRTAGFNSEPAR